MDKRILSITLMLLTVMVVISGCSARSQETDKLSVVTTIFPLYDFSRQIAGERADVRMLLKPGTESHAFDPTPMDIADIGQADVFIYIGGENEQWVERILSSMDASDVQIVKLIDCVEPIEDEDGDIDEHIWTSPRNAMLMAERIAAALTQADADGRQAYEANLGAYLAELAALDGEFAALVKGAVRTQYVLGDRNPFLYFTHAYGLTAYAAFPSCANDTEPSALTIADLIERVKRSAIPVVYKIEQSNGRMANVIAEASGAKVLTLHSCHNVTKSELESGAGYLSLMRANVQALREGLY